jgi:RNA polymerase-binding transcription factor DksA
VPEPTDQQPDTAPAPPADFDEPGGADAGIAALERIEVELNEVDAALTRLDDGTYGRCAVCDAPIPEAELAERPAAATCAHHEVIADP